MKALPFFIAIACMLGTGPVRAADNPWTKPAEAVKQSEEPPSAEEVALVRQFTVTGRLTKVIGSFSSYGTPSEGGAFKLDLAVLPKEKIEFIRAGDDPLGEAGSKFPAYMPFRGPLVIERLRREAPVRETSRAAIHLAARKDGFTFLINIMADRLEKGSKVRVQIYHAGGSFMGSMAEAEGVLE